MAADFRDARSGADHVSYGEEKQEKHIETVKRKHTVVHTTVWHFLALRFSPIKCDYSAVNSTVLQLPKLYTYNQMFLLLY